MLIWHKVHRRTAAASHKDKILTESQSVPENPFQAEEPQQKKRPSCCLRGCLSIVGLFLLGSICLVSAPSILRAAGLSNPPADVVFGAAPDSYASAQIEDVFDQSSLEGVKVYVIPEQGTKNQTAFIIFDPSSGFDGFTNLDQTASEAVVDRRVDDVLKALAARNQAENLRITRVAIDYRDENGETLTTMTTTMAEIEDYLDGEITQDEFYGQFGLGLGDLIKQVLEEYND
jgi:hypothetical protein